MMCVSGMVESKILKWIKSTNRCLLAMVCCILTQEYRLKMREATTL